MKRNYTKEEFMGKIAEIRLEVPDIALTTDLIVGFPGESIELFIETLETIKKINFFDIHVFPYSKRTGTPAASMPKQVAETIKKQRVEEVLTLTKQLNYDYIAKFINREVMVIVEGQDSTGYYHGHSNNYLNVYFKEKCQIGSLVKVKILENNNFVLGEVVYDEA
jgi:threonylcarbamoyladenosine tRNA methylthiotransferase MtaB